MLYQKLIWKNVWYALACIAFEEKLTLQCPDAVIKLLHVLLYIFNAGKYGVSFKYIPRSN
jgi:hypothetical protein